MPEAFPGATGSGLRVSVIDSGVHERHPHINGVSGGVAIGVENYADNYVDCLGHGTAVMAAIKDLAPQSDYFAVKIYFRTLQTNINQLVQALRWSIENRIDVANLSLGTVNQGHRKILLPVIQDAAAAGMLIVAAAEANGQAALPGSLPGVIAASIDWDLPRGMFRRAPSDSAGEVWLTSGYPRNLPGLPREHNLKGISFAVANLTGSVLRACQVANTRSLAAIREVLTTESDRLSSVLERSHTP